MINGNISQKEFEKIRVINLTQERLKAMEALAQLEKERGNPAFISDGGKVGERTASNEMCAFEDFIITVDTCQYDCL